MDRSQEFAYNIIQEGHNLVITGQGGTGKTQLIKWIQNLLNTKRIQVTCYTGMACQQYSDACTLHKFAGLEDGRASKEELVRLISKDERYEKIKQQICETDILVIDEVSMVSQRILSHVEHLFRNIRRNSLLFGGMQIILVGDFFQIPPVKDELYGESGKYCFETNFFKDAFPHKINLTLVHRQKESTLANVVNELERGTPTEETNSFLELLKRPLKEHSEESIKLFARNIDVDIDNYNKLENINSQLFTFHATDEGDPFYLNKIPAPKYLGLKVSCPVILIKNLDSELVNGLQGIVRNVSNDTVDVEFTLKGKKKIVSIQRQTFSKCDPLTNNVLAKRLQFPLRLAYSLTIHKAQGMSIPYLEVDCKNAHYPGQIGVAVGRAMSIDGLRILNYNSKLCRKHPKKVYEYQDSLFEDNLQESLQCCNKTYNGPHAEIENEGKTIIETEQEYHCDSDQSENDFDEKFVEKLNCELDIAENEEDPNEINTIFQNVMKDYIGTPAEKHAIQSKDIIFQRSDIYNWYKSQWMNLEEILLQILKPGLKKIENKHFTELYSKFHSYINSAKYLNSIQVKQLMEIKMCHEILTSVVFEIQRQIIEREADKVQVKESTLNIMPDVNKEVSMSGQGKIRYIAGYVVAKCRYHTSRTLKNSLFVPGLKEEVKRLQKQIEILDCFIISEAELQECTFYEETLEETKLKQNLGGGLTNVNDKCFEFFEFVDHQSRELLSYDNVMIQRKNLFKFAIEELQSSKPILDNFIQLYCYSRLTVENETTDMDQSSIVADVVNNTLTDTVCSLENILKFMLNLFLKVSVAQFRKNYLNVLKVEKSKALRTKILSKNKKRERSEITLKDILLDKSDGKKEVNHLILKAMIMEDDLFYTNFTKQELKDIGKLYGLSFVSKDTLANIGKKLAKTVLHSSSISCLTSNTDSPAGDTSSTRKKSVLVSVHQTQSKENSISIQSDFAQVSRLQFESESTKTVQPKKGKRKSSCYSKTKKKMATTKGRGRKKKFESDVGEENEENVYCPICGKLCKSDQECICCDDCDSWYHRNCVNLEDDYEWQKVSTEDYSYSCPMCL